MVLRGAGLLIDKRLDALIVRTHQRRVALIAAAGVAALTIAIAGAATHLPQRLDDQRHAFLSTGTLPARVDQRSRLTRFEANGRIEHWRVALRAFEREPLHGTGAGTFRLEWERERPTGFSVVDATRSTSSCSRSWAGRGWRSR